MVEREGMLVDARIELPMALGQDRDVPPQLLGRHETIFRPSLVLLGCTICYEERHRRRCKISWYGQISMRVLYALREGVKKRSWTAHETSFNNEQIEM
jgi:hypothetical protein